MKIKDHEQPNHEYLCTKKSPTLKRRTNFVQNNANLLSWFGLFDGETNHFDKAQTVH